MVDIPTFLLPISHEGREHKRKGERNDGREEARNRGRKEEVKGGRETERNKGKKEVMEE